jgi:hypothetical protein
VLNTLVESALISATAIVVVVGGTVVVAIAGFRISRSTNQASNDAAKAVWGQSQPSGMNCAADAAVTEGLG